MGLHILTFLLTQDISYNSLCGKLFRPLRIKQFIGRVVCPKLSKVRTCKVKIQILHGKNNLVKSGEFRILCFFSWSCFCVQCVFLYFRIQGGCPNLGDSTLFSKSATFLRSGNPDKMLKVQPNLGMGLRVVCLNFGHPALTSPFTKYIFFRVKNSFATIGMEF